MDDNIKDNMGKGGINKIYIALGLGIIIMFLSISLNYFTKNYLYNGKISENIFIQGIEVSNMSKENAIEVISKKYSPQNLNLSYENNNYEINYEDINLKYNTEEVVTKAYNTTRTGSYFRDINIYISTKLNGKKYNIEATYDEEKLDKLLSDISNSINQDVKDAKVSIGSGINITPSQLGLKFETEKNKEIIIKALDNKEYGTISLKVGITKPNISTEDVNSINTLLGSFSTDFNSSIENRSHNIALSAKRCDNVILKPGETFSYNEHTGMRTISNGYLDASVIMDGNYEDAPGGGVCQTSTTLFNAVLLSGLEIKEVRNHSKTSSYVPRGRDAMVSDGWSDFKFTNNFNHSVYVKCYRSGNNVVAAIYGSLKDKVSVNIEVDNFTYNGLPAAKTYRTITKDGKSEKSYIYTSVYKD